MDRGLDEVLRYFFLALVWLFVAYALRTTVVELRRGRFLRVARSAASDPVEPFRPPPVLPSARLRMIEPPERRGRMVEVAGEVTFGRSATCGVHLEGDRFASSLHARVYPRDGDVWVEDLGSTNGTFVNNQRVDAPARLQGGDRVRLGQTVLEVSR